MHVFVHACMNVWSVVCVCVCVVQAFVHSSMSACKCVCCEFVTCFLLILVDHMTGLSSPQVVEALKRRYFNIIMLCVFLYVLSWCTFYCLV